MKLSLYLGCIIPTEQYAYEACVREIFPRLGIELVDIEGTSCCALPLRGINTPFWLYMAARNIALAQKVGLDCLVLCNGCNLSLTEANSILREDAQLRDRINSLLKEEGLHYTGDIRIKHVLEVLHDDIGVEKIRKVVVHPIKDIKLAAYYGCHAIRPSRIGRPDNSKAPNKLEELIQVLGAETEDYPGRLECCGAGLMATSDIGAKVAAVKLKTVQNSGFDGMVTICPWCHNLLDAKQSFVKMALGEESISMPVLYYLQLLGLAMGIEEEKLALDLNLSPIDGLLKKIRGG